jgi:hypothetical protein
MKSRRRNLIIVLALAALAPPHISAAPPSPFYIGAWKIVSAAVAPWADPARKPDPSEMQTLVGRTVTILPHRITGPRALACTAPNYRIRTYPAGMLFQGAFDEMHRRDSAAADPTKLAASAGFKGGPWKTVETGCGNELDFHAIDPTTLAFGLNDYIYVLKRQ